MGSLKAFALDLLYDARPPMLANRDNDAVAFYASLSSVASRTDVYYGNQNLRTFTLVYQSLSK